VEAKQAIERIAKLKDSEIGPTEENVKQKIIVPILELLGHKRENLEFEYRTRGGGKLDIFIKYVPPDCKVIIDTKNYGENLNDHIEQIKEYTFDEASLLTLIANGTEIRIYSPLRGVAFERSLLYSIKRHDLSNESSWALLSDLLHIENLQSRNVFRKIEERERQIKEAMAKEEHLKQEYEEKVANINTDIETKEEEIEQLKIEKEYLGKEVESKIAGIWNNIALPLDLLKIPATSINVRSASVTTQEKYSEKAKIVPFKELIDAGLVRDGQILYLCHGEQLFKEEQAKIVANRNKLKYMRDDKLYSKSALAHMLLKKHGVIRTDAIRGPLYWRTENGKLLNDLEEQIRRQHNK